VPARPGSFLTLPAAALALALGLSACGSNGSGGSDNGALAAPAPTSAAPLTTTAPTPASASPALTPSPSPSTAPKSASAAPTKPPHVGLAVGDKGPQVTALQKRLVQLGFWLSAADGSYGDTTQQAVLAFQKAAGLERDGVAGPQTMKALQGGVAVSPHSTSGHVLEVDKTRQLLLIVDNGKIDQIINTSTGSGQPYQYAGATYTALTPSGQFTIFRQVDGDDPGPLGDLWRPKYFNGGIAIHGAASIPGYPASHGCARLSDAAIDWIWSNNQAPIGTSVWVY
jgi:peptidoglycan hydrolase-like protein with peptidoglycan-binding domain